MINKFTSRKLAVKHLFSLSNYGHYTATAHKIINIVRIDYNVQVSWLVTAQPFKQFEIKNVYLVNPQNCFILAYREPTIETIVLTQTLQIFLILYHLF